MRPVEGTVGWAVAQRRAGGCKWERAASVASPEHTRTVSWRQEVARMVVWSFQCRGSALGKPSEGPWAAPTESCCPKYSIINAGVGCRNLVTSTSSRRLLTKSWRATCGICSVKGFQVQVREDHWEDYTIQCCLWDLTEFMWLVKWAGACQNNWKKQAKSIFIFWTEIYSTVPDNSLKTNRLFIQKVYFVSLILFIIEILATIFIVSNQSRRKKLFFLTLDYFKHTKVGWFVHKFSALLH